MKNDSKRITLDTLALIIEDIRQYMQETLSPEDVHAYSNDILLLATAYEKIAEAKNKC